MTTNPLTPSQMQDRFGRLVAARLAAGTDELPYAVSERLRAARVQAVSRRKPANVRTATTISHSGGAGVLTFGDEGQSLWNRIASALPIIALAAGLVLVHKIENERRASEVAEVDAAILTDDLPPSAYADPGFVQFLKNHGD
jgi:hypothetical protein